MIQLISPAKINLFLQLLHRRPDDYHELTSILQTIDLHDTITIDFSSKDQLTCQDPKIPLDSSNLICKAVNLFREETGLKFNTSIHLEKQIPIQAGLGGGSSNAATVLFGLNQLFQEPLSIKELSNLGSKIGSDVPFFFSSGTAYCTGRGEIIEELPSFAETKLWIVKPNIGLSTPKIFENITPEDFSKNDPAEALKGFLNGTPNYFNDLESPAFRQFPIMKTIKNKLQNLKFDPVLMSGSGSSFFCVGKADPSCLQELTFTFETHFINRKKNKWYESKKSLR